MSKQAMKRVRRHLKLEVNREPLPAYAWPGGYPIIYYFLDGGVICPECVNKEIREIDAAIRDARGNRPHRSGCGGWAIDGWEVYYEGPAIQCDNCHKEIESAYGDPDASKDRAGAEVPDEAPGAEA